MSEERLLRDLAELVGEHERELARLEARCMSAATASTAPEADMLTPLGTDFRGAMVARLAQELAPAALHGRSTSRAEATPETSRGLLAAVTGFLNAIVQRPALGFGAVAAAVVVAVLGLGVLRTQPGGTSVLPGYELTLQGKAYMRGEEPTGSGPVTFVPGDGFRLLLRPKTALEGPVSARAFVRVGDSLESLNAPAPQVLDSGVVLIEGQVGTDVLLPPSSSHLVVVVARPDAMPKDAELLQRLSASDEASADDWHAWSVEVTLNP